MYLNLSLYLSFSLCLRPTQSMINVPLQVNRFQESVWLIVQYKILKSCSSDFILQNLILHIISYCTGFITEPSWLINFHPTTMVGANNLYQRGTSSEGASRGDKPLFFFAWFIGSGGYRLRKCLSRLHAYIYIWCIHVHIYMHIYIDIYKYICIYQCKHT